MCINITIKRTLLVLLCHLMMWSGICAYAQNSNPADSTAVQNIAGDSVVAAIETQSAEIAAMPKASMKRARIKADSLIADTASLVKQTKKLKKDFAANWQPNPKKALWMALVIPGGGQIYNRKYWKLPFVYGGFMGCAYALTWNNMMYRDYTKAYVDLIDDDPKTQSYKNLLSTRYSDDNYVEENKTRLVDLFKRRKNYFRRYRDMSMFCVIGVYLLSVVDAYVDAELSSFDISKDLSMKVKPTVIGNHNVPLKGQAYGVQCSLNF